MLTKMVRENLGFDEALKIAQELGYAETKDPVSYTHLDVYKRQGGWNVERQCASIDADGSALYKRRACFQYTSIGRTNQRAATNALGKRCNQVLG